jgi:hypothetical protein
MKTRAMRVGMRRALGIGLTAAGLAAIPIPVLPGVPLVAAGAAMLGGDHPLVRAGKNWLGQRRIRIFGGNQDELSNMQS